jgi:hypothetical protein
VTTADAAIDVEGRQLWITDHEVADALARPGQAGDLLAPVPATSQVVP